MAGERGALSSTNQVDRAGRVGHDGGEFEGLARDFDYPFYPLLPEAGNSGESMKYIPGSYNTCKNTLRVPAESEFAHSKGGKQY